MRGFTLIEVVVALTILSAGIVMVQRLHGQAALGARAAADRVDAIFLAETMLAEAGAARSLIPGVTRGLGPGGQPWRLSVTDYAPASAGGGQVFRLVVEVEPPRASRPVRLETLVIAGDGDPR